MSQQAVDDGYLTTKEAARGLNFSNAAYWDLNGDRKILRRLEPHQAERTLGVRLVPSGSDQIEYQHLRSVTRKWADNIRAGHLPHYLVRKSMETTIMKTVE
jgi:hypothetical protein